MWSMKYNPNADHHIQDAEICPQDVVKVINVPEKTTPQECQEGDHPDREEVCRKLELLL